MSEQPNSLINGSSTEYNTAIKDDIINKDMPNLQQNSNGPQPYPPQPSTPGNPQRPLLRTDSRSSFSFRPPFPNQPGAPIRPGQVRQPLPPGSQQFIQRNPVPGPGQRPQVIQGSPTQNFPQAQQQPRANFRPATPFPRAPQVQSQRPPLYPQRSVASSLGAVRTPVQEEGLNRSQTLDSTEIDYSKSPDDNKNTTNDHIKAPSIAAMNNRSYSLSSNPPEVSNESIEEARRRSISSVDSLGEGRPESRKESISGSTENLDKKQENEVPSRPESRAASRMNKIVEDEDRSPSSLTDVSQKSPDLTNSTSERTQPTISKTPDSTNSNRSHSNQPQVLKTEGEFPQHNRPPSGRPQSSKIVESGTKEGVRRNDKFLNLEKPPKVKSPARSEGDNDSGVDESTQGNDPSVNGENRSPRKSSKTRTSSTTPTARSLSRGSKSPSLKSPDSNATTPGSANEKKKVPMNKIQVGSAPSPNLKVVKSKIGSLDNATYRPGGGHVKIESKKLEFKAAAPRIEAKNDRYVPKGGEKKIVQQKLHWNAKSKVGSLDNATYKPKGGDKKIESMKLDFKEKAKPKVGSKDNIKHQPGGGDVKSEETVEPIASEKQKPIKVVENIENRKIDLKVGSKVGSLDNVKHRPGGGERKIFDDKDYLKQKSSAISSVDHSLSGSQNSLPPQQENKVPVADENLNQEH